VLQSYEVEAPVQLIRTIVGKIAGRERTIVYGIAALVVFAGAVLCFRLGNRVQSLDETEFIELAQSLAQNGQFAHINTPGGENYTERIPAGTLVQTAYRAPGYPFFLAPFTRLMRGYPVLRFANFILLAAGLVILFHTLRTIHSPLAGLLAVLGVLAYPVVIYTATTLYPQNLESFLLLAAVALAMRVQRASQWFLFVCIGLVWGALALVVPIFLLILPVLLIWMFFVLHIKLSRLLVLCAITGALVSTWTIRNALVFKAFVPVATSAGYNFASGNCAEARYNTSLDVRLAEDVYSQVTGKNEVQANHILVAAGIKWIRDNPARAASLYIEKFIHWFSYSNKLLSDQVIQGGASRIPRNTSDLLLIIAYFPMLGVALWRCALVRSKPLAPFESLCLVLYVAAGLAYAVFFTRVRFRLPVDWLLIAFDAQFVAKLLLERKPSLDPMSIG
jgi:hypothetical protein